MQRQPSTPPELAGYEFVKLLGTGGFSDVFLYDQKLPRRRVAVKVLLLEELTPQSQAAFVDEANLMAQLSTHPYIVTIYHADVALDGRPYFVMEYCSGPSLADRYKRERFAVVDALRTGIRLSSAIATAHGAGILHRDIKPANVLTNDFGWPALTDFGISSAVDTELPIHTTTLTGAGGHTGGGTTGSQSVGMSIPWSPAEMFDDNPQPDVRSDVFSLAATIHTLLAGRTPFEIPGRSNGALDLIGRIERGAITPIDRDDIPASLAAVLARGMATNRTDRFASAAEFARALQRVELELGYSQTDLDIPHLDLRHEPTDAADAGNETRVRGVATIAAQQPGFLVPPAFEPVADPTRARPTTITPDLASPAIERTIVRGPAPATEPPVAAPPPPPVEPPSRRGLIIGLVAAVVLAIVGAIVVIAVVISGGNAADEVVLPTNEPTGGGGPAVVVDAVPTPTNPTAKLVKGSVVFSWENPSPKEGDGNQYALAESPATINNLDGPTVTVPLNGAARQCILAYILRDGQRTSDGLEICYPGS